jgi:hypothetical protein
MKTPALSLAVALALPAPSAAQDVDAAVERGVEILLAMQENLDGEDEGAAGHEWPYEGVYRERGNIPPGYRVGGTAIAAWALIEAPGYGENEAAVAAVGRALDFVLETLDTPRMSMDFSGTYDVRGWGHSYALHLLLRMRSLGIVPEGRRADVDAKITWLTKTLQESEIPQSGGWNYSRRGGLESPTPASPFMTGPTVLALWEAQRQGETVDGAVLERALDVLEKSRTESGSVPYSVSGSPPKGESFMDGKPGAMGRMAIAEIVLNLAGRSGPERALDAVQTFIEHWDQLEVRRRQNGTHVKPYGVAPYYFFYAHYYNALAIQLLAPPQRDKYRALFLDKLFSVREESGGWNDRVFPRSENYGTAMSMLALMQPVLPLPAGPPPPEAVEPGAKKRDGER